MISEEEWAIHHKRIEDAKKNIEEINYVLLLSSLSPEVKKQISKNVKAMRPDHEEKVNLTIRA